jgi:hypothetical protein
LVAKANNIERPVLAFPCCPTVINNGMLTMLQEVAKKGGALNDQDEACKLLVRVAANEVDQLVPSGWDRLGRIFADGKVIGEDFEKLLTQFPH